MFNKFMAEAIEEAKKALAEDEVPVGAVITHRGKIIAAAHNLRETLNRATAHAEILAIEKACSILNSWYLTDCDLYVTLEPCIMCAGAIVNARIRSLYFGAFDPKAGACGSVIDVFRLKELNHRVTVYAGIMEDECASLLTKFFRSKR
ncbi:tRNA-specific adenosine deaminase TadA [Thermoclostridium stercorarium subsp. stercorarium DSM 8532]|uniref:tRNA-specific adenosine deaminase n=1 Tax=Thermoclostridium stercorarium (strain ATCC 35414 / DSM 8532 / NCIMB 11754) TaxID=1121335 RepID=L7VNL0_THES1|nr:tRNA adenosine(34) deaminase TadA [Thermoclostridium stercorarium]AGC67113.1 tRNA-specific adenosine deaminase TadA [Thermoclostridium stercorarium subsp. stercorarium DSM 8532]AGI38193.1 cytosine deaminase [Thermoclostridium stercorarium subsp. stercorarium DSM 8532]